MVFRLILKRVAGMCLILAAAFAYAAPEVGEPAPDWSLEGSDGATHTLSALRGQHVVIAFFPKAYTSG